MKRSVWTLTVTMGLATACSQTGREPVPVQTCVSCHLQDRNGASFPDHKSAGFPSNCATCHTQQGWKPASFDHVRFPLVGAHSWASCADCHSKEPVPKRCVGCHADKLTVPVAPDHRASGFPDSCEQCHSVEGWKPAALDHSKLPFVGGHAAVACSSCHSDPNDSKKARGSTCAECHSDARARAKDPDHLAAGFPTDCASCHDVYSWKGAAFKHDAFPLTGRHSTAACASCHSQDPVPKTCLGCHGEDRKRPTTPDHLGATFSTRCDDCHSTAGWKPAALDHSKFPLTGGHSSVPCGSCHIDAANPNVPTGKTCATCHDADRSRSTALDHLAAGFPTDCTGCHSVVKWKPATFDHGSFPLQGGHLGLTCARCHDPEPVPKTCVGCHEAERKRPVTPNHLAAGFSTACDTCHTILAWKPAAIDHQKFPLTQGHSNLNCTSCHTDAANPDVPKGKTCAVCHAADRSKATAPNHQQSGFPDDCTICHTTANWRSPFAHDRFALTGKHSTATCGSCHQRVPVPTTCVGCHDADRRTPQSPNHLDAAFSTACDSCHTTSAWKPAAFDHRVFPLDGAHASAACASCHTDSANPSKAKGKTCFECHGAERSKPSLPNHLASGFPTDCVACHTTRVWKPASFDHDQYFVTSRGKHSNLSCATCHIDPANASVFSCFMGCHEHSQSKMDDKHRGKSGYAYDSVKCLSCHKR